MRVLVIKTSSMGDVIHTFPAITDAGRALPSITFDWVVEEGFAQIPAWHPLVKNVIPVALRRWRKNLFSAKTYQEWREFRKKIAATHYDLIIDAQGLLKSAWLSRSAKGIRAGLDFHSAREPLASLFYQRTFSVDKKQHAITRVRQLFSQILGYPIPETVAEYGIDREKFIAQHDANPYLIFLHGTTWTTKHWPEEYWLALAKIANEKGLAVKLAWGSPAEKERAERIAANCAQAEALPKLSLHEVARVIAGATAVVAMDTGLGHLTAALDVPAVSLYGPTDPFLTGTLGRSQVHLSAQFACAPCFNKECTYRGFSSLKPACFETLPPLLVWDALEKLLSTSL